MTEMNGNRKGYPKCGVKKKQGGTCARPAGWGTGHPGTGACKLHLGNAPGQMLKVAKEQAIVMGAPIDIAPHEAMLHCVQMAAGEVHYCSLQIQDLELEEAVVTKEEWGSNEIGSFSKESNEASLNVWIRARREALDRLARFAKMAMDAGVEERRVRIAETMAESIAPAIKAVLDGLGLNAAQKKKAPALVRSSLALLEGTGMEKVK